MRLNYGGNINFIEQFGGKHMGIVTVIVFVFSVIYYIFLAVNFNSYA